MKYPAYLMYEGMPVKRAENQEDMVFAIADLLREGASLQEMLVFPEEAGEPVVLQLVSPRAPARIVEPWDVHDKDVGIIGVRMSDPMIIPAAPQPFDHRKLVDEDIPF